MIDLLLCALKRHGHPATAAELIDPIVGICEAENWPRRTWAKLTTRTGAVDLSAKLRNMATNGQIVKVGTKKDDNGRDAPMYAPVDGFDADYPYPERPALNTEDHPLNGTTKIQQYVIFNAMESKLEVAMRHTQEAFDLMQKHCRELRDVSARVRRDLIEAGLIAE